MCSKIRTSSGAVVDIESAGTIPKEALWVPGRNAKKDLTISSHRFIRDDKIEKVGEDFMAKGWKYPVNLYGVQILASEFEHEGRWFPVPEGQAIQAYFHRNIMAPRPGLQFVVSICTSVAQGAVAEVHDRMPLLVPLLQTA